MITKSKKHQLRNIQEYINVTLLLSEWQPTSAHSRVLLTAPTAFNRFAHICSSLLCSSCHVHCWFVCFIINVAVFWKQCRTISHSFSLAVSPRGGPSPTSGTTRGIYSAWLWHWCQEAKNILSSDRLTHVQHSSINLWKFSASAKTQKLFLNLSHDTGVVSHLTFYQVPASVRTCCTTLFFPFHQVQLKVWTSLTLCVPPL